MNPNENSPARPDSNADGETGQKRSVSFRQRFSQSVQDNHFYHSVREEPAKRAVIFFVQIVFIATFLHSAFFLYQNIPQVNRMVDNVKEQVPSITWAEDQLIVEGEVPYRIDVVKDFSVILDPESELNRSRLGTEVLAVFTNSGFYYRYSEGKFTFQSNQDIRGERWDFSSETIENYRNTILFFFALISLFASGLLQLMTQGTRVLLISAGGWLLTQSSEDPPSAGELLKMSTHLLAPLFLLDWALRLVGLPIAAPPATYEIALLCLGSYWIYRILKEKPQKNYTA